ncbi:hypothetical protein ACQF36_12635 [Streptomyces sp. Marseille-Q5077]|uniref:hypothetical protein n=1 Tax=Streptomyces sp. Marseille-Q5077 TaxID=3418995 RepID=UPI003D03F9BC
MTRSTSHGRRVASVLATAAAAAVGLGLVASPASAATGWDSLTVPVANHRTSVLPVDGQNLFARTQSICFDECTPTVRLWQKTGDTYKQLVPPAEAAPDVMAGTATDDLWVFGTRWASTGSHRIHHYNGSTWSANLSPDPKGLEVADAEAVARNSVWGAGSVRVEGAPTGWYPAVSHWDGQGWKTTKFDFEGTFDAIDVRSENDIWAVGYRDRNVTHTERDYQPLAMHYDGTGWREVPVPETPDSMYILRDVISNGPNDVWVASGKRVSHWNGSVWTRHDVSGESGAGVSFGSHGGQVHAGVNSFGNHPKLLRWNGTAWTPDTTLTKGTDVDQLAEAGDGSLYAVTSSGDGVFSPFTPHLSRLAPPTAG